MESREQLEEALATLGDVLAEAEHPCQLFVVGGGALLLLGLISRPTLDLDVVALKSRDRWTSAKPLPAPIVEAVRDVARALDLEHEPRDAKDWLNPGPSLLLQLGLPAGWETRCETRHFNALTVHIASRRDLISLKLWAATDVRRKPRHTVDVEDLKQLAPSEEEWRNAIAFCIRKDGRPDFATLDLTPVLQSCGLDPSEWLP